MFRWPFVLKDPYFFSAKVRVRMALHTDTFGFFSFCRSCFFSFLFLLNEVKSMTSCSFFCMHADEA